MPHIHDTPTHKKKSSHPNLFSYTVILQDLTLLLPLYSTEEAAEQSVSYGGGEGKEAGQGEPA
jgi:hypothetical protein